MRALIINGAYRSDGATDQLVAVIGRALERGGATVETVVLRERKIDFCLNCRACTQRPGEQPGECVLRDDMQEIVQQIEASDAFVLASPTNAGSLSALFKRFQERLIVYGYWPWGASVPKLRKAGSKKKKAVLVSTCGAPGFLGRWFFSTQGQLAKVADFVGAKACGALFSGLHAERPVVKLSPAQIKRAEALARKLL